VVIVAAILLAACAPAPRPVEQPKLDLTKEGWYGPTVEDVKALNREAATLLRSGKSDQAAAIVTKEQPLLNRLLSAAQPSLPALEAVSDSDHLYARMLLANGRYGWARLLFQKDVSRWKNWKPETTESVRRLRAAADGIAECDRKLQGFAQ
jgi:hypothetical protein